MRAALREATAPVDLESARLLFREYERAVGEPCCFAGFEQELAGLPAPYETLILAAADGADAGCVAVRRLVQEAAEMKRLYVRPAFRGRGIGRSLAEAALRAARAAGYRRMLLDSLPQMREALALYRHLGFGEVPPYLERPTPGARCFALEL